MINKNFGYRGRILHSISRDEVEDILDGVLVLDGDGRILYCGVFQENIEYKLVDLSGRLIIPGLVDVHSHISQLDARGKHGATCMSWLDKYIFPAENNFSDLNVVEDVATRFFRKMIRNGTTTGLFYSSIHHDATDLCFEIAKLHGVRAIIGKVMMDMNAPSFLTEKTSDSLNLSERLCSKWHMKENGRLRYAFTPRYAPTCSLDLWKGIGSIVNGTDIYLQTHIAETQEENDRVRELFPDFKDYFEFFERTSCATARTVLAHAIYLSDDELKRMANLKVKVAHCPTSNLFLKSGAMDYKRIKGRGIDVGLGTDVGAGVSMSIFNEMKNADFTQRAYSIVPTEAFYLATVGGARVLSMGDEIGNFKEGKWGDFNVIDVGKIDYKLSLKTLPSDDLLSLLMYRGNSEAIEGTYVGGKKLTL